MRFLHVIEGPDQGATFALPDHEPQLIGRSTESLPITDREVSRRHAELTPDAEAWYVRDLDSTNGTLLNGQEISSRARLDRGDRIQCGSTVLLFDEAPKGEIPIRAIERDCSQIEIVCTHDGNLPSDDAPAESAAELDRLEVLLRGTDLAVQTLDASDYLAALIDLLLGAFRAEHAAVLIFGHGTSSASVITVRRRDEDDQRPVAVNRELLRLLQEGRQTILAREHRDAGDGTTSVHWISGCTLRTGTRVCGVICLELANESQQESPPRADLELLHALGGQAGMAIERGELMAEILTRGRLAAMGETVAAISHGIKNILQGLRGGADAVQLAIERGDLELAGRGWPILSRNLDRIQALTMNMLGFARQRALELEPMSIETLAREAIELLEAATTRNGVRIECSFPENVPPIPLDSAATLQALLNLLSNAVDVSPRNSTIGLHVHYDFKAGRVGIDVVDAGPGVDPAVRERLFEPFVTTKGQRGTGLGLVVSRRIAERHGGTLECIRTGPNGTLMRLELPTDAPDEEPDDTKGPRGIREEDLDIEFGLPEH